jgi:hypothetical protein
MAGKIYYAKALISYYVNGRLVQTQTDGVPITILPQPKLTLNYFVPHNILSNTPFKLAVTVENSGYGEARNLNIDSGQLQITANQAGLLTDFEILSSSFGTNAAILSVWNLAISHPRPTAKQQIQLRMRSSVPGHLQK